jgi:membrane-bound lytic murein transglycosylase B
MIRFLIFMVSFLIAGLPVQGESAENNAPKTPAYSKRSDVRAFIRELVERHGFSEKELLFLFSRVRRADPVLKAISTPAEKSRPWTEYRDMLVNERRVAGGVAFWKANRAALERAEREYGVPAEYIVAIIGVETLYGSNVGRWRVIDALSTLAFDYPPRADFFRDELVHFLLLARDEGINVFSPRGSYAGAFGIPQFMPGSARRYAIDFDRNGHIDLHRSASDAVGSVANFLKSHGWRPGDEVLLEARVSGEGYRAFVTGLEPKFGLAELAAAGVAVTDLPARLAGERAALIELESPGQPSEYRIGLQNFYVLTRYNRSAFYATAVSELAREIRKKLQP